MTKKNNKLSFKNELIKFCSTVDGSISSIPDFYKAHKKTMLKHIKKRKQLEDENKIIMKNKKYYVKSKNIEEVENILHLISQTSEAGRLILPSQYVTLFIIFENYIRQLIKLTLISKKNILKETQKNISLSELLEFDNINDIISYSIEQEIDSALKNKNSIFEWIKTNLNVDIPDVDNLSNKFTKDNGVRNLLIHNNGVINKRYIKMCLESGMKKDDIPKIGEQIVITPEILITAGMNLYLMGVDIGINLWKYSKPKDIKEIEYFLIDQQIKYLNKKWFKRLEVISDISLISIKKFSSKQNEQNILINKAISLKNKKDNTQLEKILEKISKKDVRFNLAIALIKKDFKKASLLMQKIDKPSLEDYYQNWPLFKINRRSKIITKTYQKYVGEFTNYSSDIGTNE